MKNLILIAFLFCSYPIALFSQNPTYALQVKHITRVLANQYTFDIAMTWTNPGVAPQYEYAGGQYFFDINPGLGMGGTVTMSSAGSELPANMQPRNPTVFTASTPWQLRWAVNTFPGAGSGYFMLPNTPVLIVKASLQTTAPQFPEVPLGLVWRNALPSPFTKMFAYVGTINTDISTPNTHTIDSTINQYPSRIDIRFALEGLFKEGRHNSKDSVDIIIRNVTPPYSIVQSERTVVDSATLIAGISRRFVPGVYYIVVKHRNSLETWSKEGGEAIGYENFFYDFTTSASKAYGNNLTLKNGAYCIYSGNVNADNVIDADDLLLIDNAVLSYSLGSNISNLNGDQIVDIDDLAICDNNARFVRVVEWPGQQNLYKGNVNSLPLIPSQK